MSIALMDSSLPLSEYLAQYEKHMKNGYTSNKHPDQLLDTLGHGSVASFQNLLTAVQSPKYIKVLRNNTLMPLLVGLLRDTMASNPRVKLFDSYFGFLSMKLILRTVQVGVLSRLGILGPFVGLAFLDTGVAITQTLAEAVTHELRSSMNVDRLGATSSTLLPLFKSGVLLPEIGGLGHEDLLFLLEALWEDRKQFLMVISHGKLFSLGWSALFCMIFKQFEAKKSFTTSKQWANLFRLVHRYRLYTTEKDEGLAERICEEIEARLCSREPQELPAEGDCVDKEDAQLIVQAYIARVASRSKSKGEFPSSISLVWASRAPFEAIINMKAYDLAPSFTEASIAHMWGELATLKESCELVGVKKAIDQIHFHVSHTTANYNVVWTAKDMYKRQRLTVLRVLVGGEFIQVLSRALLAYTTHFTVGEKIDYGGCRRWQDLLFILKETAATFERRLPDNLKRELLMFQECFSDLRKACRQSEVIMGLYEPIHPLYKFARDSLRVLDGFLRALSGFDRHEFERLVPPSNCAYNRCPAACWTAVPPVEQRIPYGGCTVTDYCSEECLIRDWEFSCPRPYRAACDEHVQLFH